MINSFPWCHNLQGRLNYQVSMSNYTSWRVGGLAEVLYVPKDLADLQVFMQNLPDSCSVNFFGLGSNVLVRDGGLKGTTIITQGALQGLTQVSPLIIRAEAGVSCGQLARYAARLGLQGLEFMAGIPGTIGGALAMNAGCYGGQTWDWVLQVEMIDRYGNLTVKLANTFQVGYRYVDRGDAWFVSALFQLVHGDKDLALVKINKLLKSRNKTQPANLPTCGSVFRNPENDYAARLIEGCGLKGYSRGKAVISTKHANFIVNEGGASASDIEFLVEEVRSIVQDKYAVTLVPEVCIIGDY